MSKRIVLASGFSDKQRVLRAAIGAAGVTVPDGLYFLVLESIDPVKPKAKGGKR